MTDKLKELIYKDSFTMPQKTKEKLDETLESIRIRHVRTRKIIPIVATLVIVLTISVFAISPSLARNIPGISYIFNHLFGYDGEYNKFSQNINQTITDNGYTITLNSAVLDDKELVLGFTVVSTERIEDAIYFMDAALSTKKLDLVWNDCYMGGNGSLVDKNTYISTLSIDLSEFDVPEKADFKFVIKDIIRDRKKPLIHGDWSFDFSVSKTATSKDSCEFKVNKKVTLGSRYITINKVSVTPLNTTIYFTGEISDKLPAFCLVDDKGRQIAIKGGSSNSKGGYMQFDRLSGSPGSITLWPYVSGKPEWIIQSLGKLPVTIEQGKVGNITIDKIDFLSDRTDVYYSIEGILPLDRAYEIILVNKVGKDIYRDRNTHSFPEQMDSSQKKFKSVFPACNKEDIKEIKTIDFDKYYKFFDPIKIELK